MLALLRFQLILKKFTPLPAPGTKTEYETSCKLGKKLKINQNRKLEVGDFTLTTKGAKRTYVQRHCFGSSKLLIKLFSTILDLWDVLVRLRPRRRQTGAHPMKVGFFAQSVVVMSNFGDCEIKMCELLRVYWQANSSCKHVI